MTQTPSAASVGVQDPALAILLEQHWNAMMERWPVWATQLGDHRFDDRLPDNTPEKWAAMRAGIVEWLARVAAIDADQLTRDDALTLAVLADQFESAQATAVCKKEQWNVAPVSNAFSTMNALAMVHPVHTTADGDNLVARYRAIPTYIKGAIDSLRLGMADDLQPNATSLQRTIEVIDAELKKPVEQWALFAPAVAARPAWNAVERGSFHDATAAAITDHVKPAYQAYRDFLHDELLPVARPPERAGIGHLKNGAACYAASIREQTTLDLTAAEIHAIGLSELESIHAEFSEIGQRLWNEPDLKAIFQRLRTDPALYFDSSEAIQQKAESALERASAAMPDWFGILPQTPCVVVPIPDYQAKYSTIAYYRPPTPGGGKPGEYYINLSEPTTRPRHEAEVLAYHESIPGHHLQIAIAQEQGALPNVRRHFRATAYVEGWGLYIERLADEMGLYSSDLDRLGMLSFDAWRASRLVVDTGIHDQGWTRQQAQAFLLANTPLAENNIDVEVDRYISWPGQALAYKLGQRHMRALRSQAEQALGERFGLSDFHDEVLKVGAIPLPALQAHIQQWIDRTAAP